MTRKASRARISPDQSSRRIWRWLIDRAGASPASGNTSPIRAASTVNNFLPGRRCAAAPFDRTLAHIAGMGRPQRQGPSRPPRAFRRAAGMKCVIVPVTPFQQNCTLLWDEESMTGAVVDPGGDLDRIAEAIAKHGVTVEKVLLTH